MMPTQLNAERLSAMTAAERKAAQEACSLDNPDSCEMCSG
jgi:hypothetical protein